MLRTIDDVLRGLPFTDARRDWWKRVQSHIAAGKYGLAITLLSCHEVDDDYDTQCRVIAHEIDSHASDPLNDPALNPESDR